MRVGRLHHLVLDGPDPRALAAFWGEVLGWERTHDDDDWVVVADTGRHSGLAFQRVPDHVAPAWPDPHRPQQLHLDVMVDDLDAAGAAVLALGARPLARDGSDHVYADPAGHPFCLVRRPPWAPPVRPGGA